MKVVGEVYRFGRDHGAADIKRLFGLLEIPDRCGPFGGSGGCFPARLGEMLGEALDRRPRTQPLLIVPPRADPVTPSPPRARTASSGRLPERPAGRCRPGTPSRASFSAAPGGSAPSPCPGQQYRRRKRLPRLIVSGCCCCKADSGDIA